MIGLHITLVALVAFASAVPTKPHLKLDTYQNTLRSSHRIVDGEDAARGQFPYQVSILFLGLHSCGGTLITQNLVLTAAHCNVIPFPGLYQVVVGQLTLDDKHQDVQRIDVASFETHSGYPGGAAVAGNDIAVIVLKTPVIFSASVQIAQLPTDEECNASQEAVLSGWGVTTSSVIALPSNSLKFANLPIISIKQCEANLIELMGNAGPLDTTMICTVTQEGRKQSACSGDSGGPLAVTRKDGSSVVIGVVSWGLSPCGTEELAPSVFTNVCSHKSFINRFTIYQ